VIARGRPDTVFDGHLAARLMRGVVE